MDLIVLIVSLVLTAALFLAHYWRAILRDTWVFMGEWHAYLLLVGLWGSCFVAAFLSKAFLNLIIGG